MQMRKTNHSIRSNQSNGQYGEGKSKMLSKQRIKRKQQYSIDENDHEMESDDDGKLNHDIGLASFDDQHHEEAAEMIDQQMRKVKSKHSMNMSSGDEDDQSQEESEYDE